VFLQLGSQAWGQQLLPVKNRLVRKMNKKSWIRRDSLDKQPGDRKKLHNEGLHNLYSSPNTMIKSRRMRWAGHVARMGQRIMYIGYWWESQK
jgi:hypothetical protein